MNRRASAFASLYPALQSLCLALVLTSGLFHASAQALPYIASADYDPSVPTIQQVLGYASG